MELTALGLTSPSPPLLGRQPCGEGNPWDTGRSLPPNPARSESRARAGRTGTPQTRRPAGSSLFSIGVSVIADFCEGT